MEEVAPLGVVVARLGADLVEQGDGFGPARQDRQGLVHAAEVELDHQAVVTLLDQETMGRGHQLVADQPELGLAQAEAVDVVAGLGVSVG